LVVNGQPLHRRWLLCLLCCLATAGCGPSKTPLDIGEPVADISLAGADGKRLTVPSSLQGQVVLIHFWADWCPLCLQELEGSNQLAQRYRQAGLAILAINLEQAPEEVADWIERLKPTYPVLFDRQGEAARQLGVTGLPSSYLIDREGRLRRRLVGEMAPSQLEQLIKEML
jgi:peroxiredoxin